MKTQLQIEFKLAQHEREIEKIFDSKDEIDIYTLISLRNGRQCLLWVLSDEPFIKNDDITKKIDFELLCDESTKIF